jgi:hypothetical protein
LVRRTPAAVCHKDPCPLQYFFAVWGLWPPTRFFRVPCTLQAWPMPSAVLRSLGCGGKGDLMANLGRRLVSLSTLPALLLWQSVSGEDIPGCTCLRLYCSLLLPESHMRDNPTLVRDQPQPWDASREQWTAEGENQPCTWHSPSKKQKLGTRSPSMFREAGFASRFLSFACPSALVPWLNLGHSWVSEP